jgi:hypothetical protein
MTRVVRVNGRVPRKYLLEGNHLLSNFFQIKLLTVILLLMHLFKSVVNFACTLLHEQLAPFSFAKKAIKWSSRSRWSEDLQGENND